jgi:hypothetical protein
MAIIYGYPRATPTLSDTVLGTQFDYEGNPTKSFLISDIVNLASGSNPTYKVFTALLNQTGGNAPVATVLENTIGAITFTYLNQGYYNINSNALFTNNKTAIFFGPYIDPEAAVRLGAEIQNTSEINIGSVGATGPTNNLFTNIPIEIRVYN